MKKIFGVLILAAALAAPTAAVAGEQVGIYVAPKFVYGLTKMDNGKGYGKDTGSPQTNSVRIGDETDNTFGGALALGYDFEKKFGLPIRAELEYAAFTEAEAERTMYRTDGREKLKQTHNIQTLFVNAYWDISTGTRFTPYLGAGVGLSFIKSKLKANGYELSYSWSDSTGSKRETNFAWNLAAGLGWDITQSWSVEAGYRFVGLGSAKTKTYNDADGSFYGKTGDVYQHQFALGVRYTF